MTRAELKSMAKDQISGRVGVLFLINIIIAGLETLFVCIPFFGTLGSYILTPAFTLSIAMIYLNLTKNKDVEIKDAFNGFSQFGKTVWMNILMTVYLSLWSLLFIIPGLIKSLAYSMSHYVLADNPELSANVIPYMNATMANFYNSIKE